MPDARSKSRDEFAASVAPAIDFISTETCPLWPGRPTMAHRGIDDPAHVEVLAARRAAFEKAYCEVEIRVRTFLALPLETMSPEQIHAAARAIHPEAGG